jgi:hypothetical protein
MTAEHPDNLPATAPGLADPVRSWMTGLGTTSIGVALGTIAVSLFGLIGIAIFAATGGGWRAFGIGILLALAAGAVGGLAGFLFGLPRYNSIVQVAGTAGPIIEDTATQARAARSYTPSNNLEQISDWLTKILLGAGLVQIDTVSTWIGQIIDQAAQAFTGDGSTSDTAVARVLVGSTLAVYAITGFAFVYISMTLWYRIKLQLVERATRPTPDRCR